MKIKFNWGTGILITIILFFLSVVAFFIYSSNLDINLVEENYYEKELAYQEKIDRINNTQALDGKVQIDLSNQVLTVVFPDFFKGKKPQGNVWFYRPSDPKRDVIVPLQLNDSAIQVIDASRLDPGRYTIKIDWTQDGKGYYWEEEVFNR